MAKVPLSLSLSPPLLTELVEVGQRQDCAPACRDDPGVDPGLLDVVQHDRHPQPGEQASTALKSCLVLRHQVVTHIGLTSHNKI